MTFAIEELADIPVIRENAARKASKLRKSHQVSKKAMTRAGKFPEPAKLPDMPEWQLVAEHDLLPISKATGAVIYDGAIPRDKRILACTGKLLATEVHKINLGLSEMTWDEKAKLLACGFKSNRISGPDLGFISSALKRSRDARKRFDEPYMSYLGREDLPAESYPLPTLRDHMRVFMQSIDEYNPHEAPYERAINAIARAYGGEIPPWWEMGIDTTWDEVEQLSEANPFARTLLTACAGIPKDKIAFCLPNGMYAEIWCTLPNGDTVNVKMKCGRYVIYRIHDGLCSLIHECHDAYLDGNCNRTILECYDSLRTRDEEVKTSIANVKRTMSEALETHPRWFEGVHIVKDPPEWMGDRRSFRTQWGTDEVTQPVNEDCNLVTMRASASFEEMPDPANYDLGLDISVRKIITVELSADYPSKNPKLRIYTPYLQVKPGLVAYSKHGTKDGKGLFPLLDDLFGNTSWRESDDSLEANGIHVSWTSSSSVSAVVLPTAVIDNNGWGQRDVCIQGDIDTLSKMMNIIMDDPLKYISFH